MADFKLMKNMNIYIGASTDTKPATNVLTGSKSYEYDTGCTYITYDNGAHWNKVPDVNANNGYSSKVSQTRPNDANLYAIGDVVGAILTANMVFTNVSAFAGSYIILTGVTFEVDVGAVPAGMSSFRLHLYTVAPTAIADNAVYNLPEADRVKYSGFVEIPTPSDCGDTLWSETWNVGKIIKLAAASTTLFGILETRGTYTPTALIAKSVTIYTIQV